MLQIVLTALRVCRVCLADALGALCLFMLFNIRANRLID